LDLTKLRRYSDDPASSFDTELRQVYAPVLLIILRYRVAELTALMARA